MLMFDKGIIQKIRRRDLLALAGKGVIAVAGVGLISNKASADSAAVSEAMKKSLGGKSPKTGRISLELPQIAENGNTVPIAVEVQSPMSSDDYVKALHVYAEGNPAPDVATFRFTPQSGKARVSTRMRMIKSQNIVAVAEMSDGSVYMGKKAVKVTIGGCGG
jgi:sulfur-oxidizing protein SoxY